MKKPQLIIIGKDVPTSIITQAIADHPDHEVIVVENLAEWKRQQAMFAAEPIRLVCDNLKFPEPLRMPDMKFHNPWPEPHHSSKKKRKY